jgi:hypothetical protein
VVARCTLDPLTLAPAAPPSHYPHSVIQVLTDVWILLRPARLSRIARGQRRGNATSSIFNEGL